MASIAGIDGCKGGWFCIFEELPSRQLASKIFPPIDELVTHVQSLDVVAIDVPIGLTDRGPRACDVAARKMLGGLRGTSVFPAPIRPALGAATYEDACSRSFEAQGTKLPKQSWGIYPKIRELDELLRARPAKRTSTSPPSATTSRALRTTTACSGRASRSHCCRSSQAARSE